MKNRKLAIIDNHKLFRGLLIRELECCYGYETLYYSNSGLEFLDSINSIEPELIIVSLSITDISASDLVYRLKRRGISCPIIAINHGVPLKQVKQILEVGATSVLNYTDDLETVLQALQNPESGSQAIGKSISLSGQEMNVLNYLHQGYSTDQVAEALQIASSTIDTYRHRLLVKTHSKNTAELVSYTNSYKRGVWPKK